MANLFDYLQWRGDLTLEQDAFNQVDALILARLSYLPFDVLVPGGHQKRFSLEEVAEKFALLNPAIAGRHPQEDYRLLVQMAKGRRFRNMYLSGYISELDYDMQKQFSAMTVSLDDTRHFISYRGTDNTLVGWKEDFNMTFRFPVPAQERAVAYLEQTAAALPGTFLSGGHSKGGNLAVYAAAFCEEQVQERMSAIYNFDGPGFNGAVLDSPSYQAVRSRVQTFTPQSSIVALLLEHEEQYRIVRSKQAALRQHDLYSWELDGPDFIYLEEVTAGSKFIDKTLKDWLAELDPEQREQFIDAMYSVLSTTEVKTVHELSSHAQPILRSLNHLDDPVKNLVSETLRALVRSARHNLPARKPVGTTARKAVRARLPGSGG